MQGTKNPNESVVSQEQFQEFILFFTEEIKRAQQQDVNKIGEVITQTLTNDFSFIEKKFENINSSLEQLRSDQINQNEIKEGIREVASIVSDKETQESIVKNINKELVDKFEDLSPVKKALVKSGLVSAAGATIPVAIVGAAIAIPVALVALPLVLLYTGLKRAMPSKAEFEKTWQGISHDFKNAIDKVPTVQEKDSNIKKLFCDLGVKEEHKNFIKEYIVKNDGSKDQLKVDDNKIEAFKKAALTIGVNIDIKALSEKGKSTFDSDYEKFKTQIEKVISTIDQDVLESQEMKDTFKDKLTEIKQAKEEKAAEKKNSFLNKVKDKFQRRSSYAEGVTTERSSSSQDRRNSIRSGEWQRKK